MPKRILTGTVVSDKGDKTIVVKVERKVKHPLYGKIIRRSKKYHAHDEANAVRTGEVVRIEETKPISKLKTWRVLDVVGGSADIAPTVAEITANDPKGSREKNAGADNMPQPAANPSAASE
jgi:small subunit ribosomal protein S17